MIVIRADFFVDKLKTYFHVSNYGLRKTRPQKSSISEKFVENKNLIMKTLITSFLSLACLFVLRAQAPTFDYFQHYVTDSIMSFEQSVIDNDGNLYLYGALLGSADLDPGAGVANFTSPGTGGHLTFLQKQSPDGTVLWTREIWGVGIGQMCVDNLGNLITATSVNGNNQTIDVDPGAGTTNVTFGSSVDVTVIKYNTNGDVLWAQAYGLPNETETVRGITADNNNNIIFTAYAGNGAYNYAMNIKLNPSGNLMWQKNLTGPGYCSVTSITTDASNNVIIGGRFRLTIDFDPGAGTQTLNSNGSSEWDIFVVKLNSSGDFVWVNEVNGISNNLLSEKVAVDADGNIYQLGGIRGTNLIDFDPSAGVDELSAILSSSSHRIFLRKLNANGTHAWVKLTTNYQINSYNSLSIDALNQAVITGGGGIHLFDADGNILFEFELAWGQYLTSLAASPNGSIYATGWSYDNIEFDSSNPNGTLIYSGMGQNDAFVVKYNQCYVNNATTISGATITATQADATYQWINCDNANAPIAGATAQSYSPTASGSYAVIVTNGACADTSACQTVTISTSGIEEQTENDFNIYPNPAIDLVTLNNLPLGTTIQVTDMTGKTVIKTSVTSAEMTFDVQDMNEGIYFVTILNNTAVIGTKKLVKIK